MKEIESLKQQLAVAESFHRVAIQQRDAAWAELKALQNHKVKRKAFICKNCEGVYADQPVTQCDCLEGAQEFYEGVILYG